jgi:hypothetical protein
MDYACRIWPAVRGFGASKLSAFDSPLDHLGAIVRLEPLEAGDEHFRSNDINAPDIHGDLGGDVMKVVGPLALLPSTPIRMLIATFGGLARLSAAERRRPIPRPRCRRTSSLSAAGRVEPTTTKPNKGARGPSGSPHRGTDRPTSISGEVLKGCAPNPPDNARWDLNGDGKINGSNFLKLEPFFGKTCA